MSREMNPLATIRRRNKEKRGWIGVYIEFRKISNGSEMTD
jgi:hypothetical protein